MKLSLFLPTLKEASGPKTLRESCRDLFCTFLFPCFCQKIVARVLNVSIISHFHFSLFPTTQAFSVVVEQDLMLTCPANLKKKSTAEDHGNQSVFPVFLGHFLKYEARINGKLLFN